MRSYDWLACVALLSVPLGASAQQNTAVEASDYSDYFGESRNGEGEGPRSLGEARAKGKAYRLGQNGSVYRKPTQEFHTVHQGDTLWQLSDRYFGDPYHWPELWSYNPEITNPHWIYPLDQVRLSAASDEEQQLVAAVAAGKSAVEGFKEPRHALATDLAPNVRVPPKLLTGDTVFLRDEGYLDEEELKESGRLSGANEEQ
ncbi:MAG TPA: LysM domain-containing protein, partial [Polyangiales bacterium]|nr:LysM domain-containing protein [Polyangiales bacterium]